MKKINYVILAAAFVLVGCQSKDVSAETETIKIETPVEIEISEEMESSAQIELAKQQTSDQLHVALTRNYESEWNDEHRLLILTAESDNIRILNDDYEVLNDKLALYNREIFQELLDIYEENLEWARVQADEGNPGEWFISRDVDVVRADEMILSFWNTEIGYLGGAHGSYYSNGVNFDPKTGEILELRDVVTDYEKLYDMVLDQLTEQYEEETFFEGWQGWLDEMFFSTEKSEENALEWTMDDGGITVCFNPYVISSWAAGTMEVKIPFEKNESLFLPEYICRETGRIKELLPGERYGLSLDTDENGAEELISFSYEENGDTFKNSFQIMKEDGDMQITRDTELYGLFSKAYVIEMADGDPYLYVELLRENDRRLLEIFDLGEKFCHIGTCDASLYDNPMTNTDSFLLYQTIYVLGTYMAYQEYRIGDDGIPVTEDEIFHVPDLGEDYGFKLTSTRELAVKMHQDRVGIEKKDEILPSGTEFTVRKTDGETFVEMELSDGRRCDILLERDMENYGFLIDGINEFECFEMLPYAG